MKSWQAVGVLVVLGLLSYGNAIDHPFVHDDVVFIQNNPRLDRFDDIPSLFLGSSKSPNTLPIINAYYRPLLDVLYKTQHFFFGLNPHAFHLFNILLHIANSVLVFVIAIFLLKNRMAALGIAAIFLVHPVQSEAVACIAGVSNLLYAFFVLSGFYCYGVFSQCPAGKRSYVFYASALVFFVLGILTKEQGLVLFFLILLYESCSWRGGRHHARTMLSAASGFGAVFFGYLLWRKIILQISLPPIWDDPQELYLRLLSIPKTLLIYLKTLVFPVDLHYYRCLDILQPWLGPLVLFGALLSGGLYGLRALSSEERRLAIFGVGWFILALLPVLNIAPLIVEYSYIMTSEHFLYLPVFGFLISGYVFLRRWPQIIFAGRTARISSAAAIGLILILTALTIKQNTYWKSETVLFQRTAKYESGVGRIQILLARAYLQEGRLEEAIMHFRAALGILQGYVEKTPDPRAKKFYQGFIKEIYCDAGRALEAKGDVAGALRSYQEAIALDSKDSVVYNNLGMLHMKMGRLESAVEAFQKSLDNDPGNALAMNNLAITYIQRKEYNKAEKMLREAIAVNPDFAEATKNLENLLKNEKF